MPEPRFTFSGDVQPVCELGLSTAQQAEPASWLDVSCYVHTCELFRGRDRFSDRFQPGTASLTFSNSNGWADISGSGGATTAAATLRPGRPIRVGVHGPWAGGPPSTRWLWRGWVDQCVPRYDPVEHDVVDVNCIDAFGEAGTATAMTAEFQGANELVEERVNRVLDALGWFPTKRKIGSSGGPLGFTTVQGTTLGGTGIDLMGQAADSDGGVVYGDNDGDVVFRNRDWMLYDPDTPPDGGIGNVDPGTPLPPYTPGYLDPEEGYVYWPDPPPFESPTVLTVCATTPGGVPTGSLIAQGDLELYVEKGQLRFTHAGRVWDLGLYPEGGCVGVVVDGDDVTRIDDPDSDGVYEIAPFPAPEIFPPPVELIYYTDHGAAQPPQASVTPGPIRPGPGRVLVVLFNAIGTESVPPEGLQATISGGGLTWIDVWHRDTPDVGASGWVWVADIGRDDPGLFSLSISWEGVTGAHCCTVWRCNEAADDFVAHCIDGTVLQAVTNSNPPDEIEPGNGPNSATLESRSGTVDPPTPVTDVTIAQSLADEITEPYGAVFDDTEGAWIVPSLPPPLPGPGLLDVTFSDDFDRADGPLGAPDYASLPAPPAYRFWVPLFIVDGHVSWTGHHTGTDPRPAGSTRIDHPIDGNQTIELVVSHIPAPGSGSSWNLEVELFAQVGDTTDMACVGLYFQFQIGSAGVTGNDLLVYGFNDDPFEGVAESWGTHNVSGVAIPDSVTLRLESDVDGTCRAYLDDVLLFTGTTTFTAAPYVGFALTKWQTGTVPWVESVATSSVTVVPLKTSWVAGYRPDAVASSVAWTDVNLGPSDIQSTQAAIVVECGPNTNTDLVLGGETNPYTGTILSAERRTGSDPNGGTVIWSFDPADL